VFTDYQSFTAVSRQSVAGVRAYHKGSDLVSGDKILETALHSVSLASGNQACMGKGNSSTGNSARSSA